jgi:glutathione S-transferase
MLTLLQENARTTALLAVAKENKLDIEFVETRTPIADDNLEYIKLNPLKQVPTFVGANGFVLTESIAIAIYCEQCPAIPQFLLSKMSHIITFSYPCLNPLC